jgi:3-hydroxybutyryl-CoA dehydrogenase
LVDSHVTAESWCDKEIKKERLTNDEKYNILNTTTFSTKLEDLHDTDFVVEAIVENFKVKRAVFQEVDKVLPHDAILASNTSSISITKLAGAVPGRAANFIGMHFMNPVPVMKLVEIIPGLQTDSETLDRTLALAKEMNKTTTKARDVPGFIANRILIPYINEAA